MNFFQSISALQVAGDWKINIAKESAERFVVSVLFYNDKVGDDAAKRVPPILLKGTAQELDEGFFAAIEKPVKETAQLFINMQQFLKERGLAKANSQMQKAQAEKSDKVQAGKDKKYEEAMKKADELEAAGKYREAWVKVPEPTEYPEKAEILRKRKSALAAKFLSPDLFGKEPQALQPEPVAQEEELHESEDETEDEVYDDIEDDNQ